MSSKRTCTAKTRKGTRCTRNPLNGHTVCIGHAPEDVKASRGFGGAQPNSGRPRLPRPSEIAQQLIERNVLALQRPYWLALGYDVVIGADGPELVQLPDGGAKVYGESKDGDIVPSDILDLEAQQKAAERLQDRVYGRPKQSTELSGLGDVAAALAAPADATEKSTRAAALLKNLGQV